ncbi:hypothetical protein [Bordetella tumbae]|uniref:hypothetical protein n=1 Tax=Bordetella tumbae TaxID=1649139 RepID=UPI0039EE7B16
MIAMQAMNFQNKTKKELEAMLSIQADLNRAERSLDAIRQNYATSSEVMAALYTQFLVSYVRSFASGRRKGLREDIFTDRELLAIHRELKGVRDRHIAHPVSDHEQCVVLAAVPEPSRNELVGLGVRYWFFVADAPEKLSEYRRPLEFALSHVNAEAERLGDQLAQELLGEGHTWESAQGAFWSVLSAEDVFGPGADDAMGQAQR